MPLSLHYHWVQAHIHPLQYLDGLLKQGLKPPEIFSHGTGNVTAIHAINGAVITINGGTVTGATGDGKQGKVFYSGVNSETNSGGETPGKIIVTGGTFDGRMSTSNWGKYEISGGIFKTNEVQNYTNPIDETGKPTGTSVPTTPATVTMAVAGWLKDGYGVVAVDGGTYKVAHIAQISETYYGTLAAAIAAATEGQTVTLLENVTEQVSINKTMTLDLNGHNITASGNAIDVTDGTLTIKGSGEVSGSSIVVGVHGNTAKAVIDGGTYRINNTGNVALIYAYYGGEITINDGTFTGKTGEPKDAKVIYAGAPYETNGNQGNHGKIIVTGGNFTGRLSDSNWGEYEISGGTFDRNTVQKYNSPASGDSTNTNTTWSMAEAGWLKDGYVISTLIVPGKYVVDTKRVYVSTTQSGDTAAALLGNPKVSNFGDTGIQGMSDVDRLVVVLTDVNEVSGTVSRIAYNVTPMLGEISKTTPSAPITFRLAVPSTWTGAVKVTHTHNSTTSTSYYPILGTAPNKYIELSSNQFSEFVIESQTDEELAAAGYVAKTGTTAYTKIEEAFTAAVNGETVTLLDDCIGTNVPVAAGKSITLDLNGKTLFGSVDNQGTLTVTGTGTIAAIGTYNSDVSGLIDNELVNCIYANNVSTVTAKNGTVYSIDAAVSTTTDRVAGTTDVEVYAGDTVTVDVSVTGGTYVGAAVTLTYAPEKFALTTDPLPTGWTHVTGTLKYYNVNNEGYFTAGNIGSLSFTALAQNADANVNFSLASSYVATAWSYGWNTNPANVCANNGTTAATIILQPIAVPAAITGLTYSGSVQTGVSTSTGYTLTGNTGTNAGTYKAIATLTAGYKWNDGTTAAKEISWSIAKAAVSVNWSIPDYTYTGSALTPPTATYGNETVTVTLTAPSGGVFQEAGAYAFTASISDNYTITNSMQIVTIKPDTHIETSEYVAGYNLVLVFTNSGNVTYTYNNAQMYELASGWYSPSSGTYSHIFGMVVKDAADTSKVAYTVAETGSTYVLSESAIGKCDVNKSGSIDINDAVAVQAIANTHTEYMTNHMDVVLKADVYRDRKVDMTDFSLIKALY